MNVHEAISQHSRNQHEHLQIFEQLDSIREQLIQDAVDLCLKGESFSTEAINQVTARIIEHAKHGISPLRQFVNEDMVRDYVEQLKQDKPE
jgi:CTP:phosphocholine cytidylyltransferase-like protein